MRGWLKTLRKDNNLTAAEMADRLGISESYYSLIENGERQKKMDIVLVTRIAEVLNKSIVEIINLENTK